jgi:broad specificity phosphatase PhoE
MCYGATDLPAEQDAFDQQLQACLAMPRPALVLSSPLVRCAHLAHALGREAWPAPLIHDGLAEMNFGQWEMRPWKGIARTEVEAWIADIGRVAPPGGESVEQVGRRAARSLAEVLLPLAAQPRHREALIVKGGVVAVICHSGVIQSLSHALTDVPWSAFKSSNLGYGEHRDVVASLAWLERAQERD